MGDGPDEKVTTPAMPAVHPWARIDRLEASLHSYAENCAERFGEAKARAEGAAEKCAADGATTSRRIDANASACAGLEKRIVELERWRPLADAASSGARDVAAKAQRDADAGVKEMQDAAKGLAGILANTERTTAEREDAKKLDRDAAAKKAEEQRLGDEATRAAATKKHEARFDSLGDAAKRQAAGIVTVSEAVTSLQADVSRAVKWALRLFAVGVAGFLIIVATVLLSRPADTVKAPRPPADAGGEPK